MIYDSVNMFLCVYEIFDYEDFWISNIYIYIYVLKKIQAFDVKINP